MQEFCPGYCDLKVCLCLGRARYHLPSISTLDVGAGEYIPSVVELTSAANCLQDLSDLAPIDQTLEKEHHERTKVKNIQVIELGRYEVRRAAALKSFANLALCARPACIR